MDCYPGFQRHLHIPEITMVRRRRGEEEKIDKRYDCRMLYKLLKI